METLTITLVQGSLHGQSSTAAMLRYLDEVLQGVGCATTCIDLKKVVLPLYSPDSAEDVFKTYPDLKTQVMASDCFVLGTPDYHGTPSGAMKNFLDYFWHEFTGKLFGYVCASHEKGLTVMDSLRVAVRQCYGWSMPYGISGIEKADVEPGGAIVSEKLRARLTMLAYDIVHYGQVMSKKRGHDKGAKYPSLIDD